MTMINITPQLLASLPVERVGALLRLLIAALPLLLALVATMLAIGYGGGLLLALAIQRVWKQEQGQ